MNEKKTASKMISLMSKQSLKSSRMRNFFVMITIVLASALLTAILMFAIGQRQQVKNDLSHRQQVVYFNLTGKQVENLQVDERIFYQIKAKMGVRTQMDGFDVMPCYLSGLSEEIRVFAALEQGELPKEEHEIAVQAAMLEKMGIEPQIGSKLKLDFYDGSIETFTISGILNGSENVKQFSVLLSESYAESGSQLKDVPYEVYAKIYGAASMGAEECKETMFRIGKDAGIDRKNISPSKEFLDSLSVNMQFVMLYSVAGAVILLACVLVVYGVFYLSVIGRIHQFGQLRTIGATKKQMKKFVSHEGRMLYLRSAPVGILIGSIAGYFIIPDGFHIWNTLWIIVLVFVVIYVITMVSVHKPARLAAAVSPMEALRYVSQDGMKKTANKKFCRKLSPMGLGFMNFSKNRKKAIITMLSLSLGGILFMTAATYMSSFDKEKYTRQGYFADAEFHIGYAQSAIELNENGLSGMQAEMPLDSGMVQEISSLDGVEKVTEIKSFGVRFDYPENDEYGNDDMIYPLTGEETKEIVKYLEDGSCDYDKLMSGDYILTADNGNVAEIYGWEFKVGDTIVLHYYDGSKMVEKDVTILGILNDEYSLNHDGLEGWFLMPGQVVLNWLSYDSLNAHLLVSTDMDKEEIVQEALTGMLEKKSGLDLETYAERKVVYEQAASQVFVAISGLAIFIMMFSILSMMNTLITNIITRKQELAMLEAIGMSKVQIRKMLLGESLFMILATVGVTITTGTLSGYVLSNMLYNMGAFYMAFQFPMNLALIYAGVLVAVPLLITLVLMHNFSKEALVERLRGMEN